MMDRVRLRTNQRDRETRLLRRLQRLAPDCKNVADALRHIASNLLTGIEDIPVNLEFVAERLGVSSIVPVKELSTEGQLHRTGDGFEIRFRSASRGRERFTIAHELGHAVLERTGARPPRSGPEVERICDRFAGYLLMPERPFLAEVGGEISVGRLRLLAERFATSLRATAHRYTGVTDTSVLYWSPSDCWSAGDIDERAPVVKAFVSSVKAGEAPTVVDFGDSRLRRVEIERKAGKFLLLFTPLNRMPQRARA
jgi:hypothetical protein